MKKVLALFVLIIVAFGSSSAQNAAAERKDWFFIGNNNSFTEADYPLLYHKIAVMDSDTVRYSSIFQVAVQGDANHYNAQGTFEVRIDKWESTPSRFDGLEVRCISGNPQSAVFYVFNNALWVRANFKWGYIYLHNVTDFTAFSPRIGTIISSTVAPAGALIIANGFGVKCDFDENKVYQLPYTDIGGNVAIGGTLNTGNNEMPKLSVNGTVMAKKIKVTSSSWADFVFDPAYELPSLDNVKDYVKTHKHLPEIPSAATIEKEGIDIGEMNKKLLQKIEELTLYLIELKEKNQEQESAINKLNKRLDNLEAKK
jgi:hypothetical protein